MIRFNAHQVHRYNKIHSYVAFSLFAGAHQSHESRVNGSRCADGGKNCKPYY